MGRKLLGVLLIAIIALLLSVFGPWSAQKRSAEMKNSIVKALAADGVEGVSVDMSGNVANLSGTVASSEVAEQATRIAKGTECETCKKKDKLWHEITSDLNVKEVAAAVPAVVTASPYTFNAVKAADGGVSITGYVRNAAENDRVTREAQSLFGANLNSIDLNIAQGQPNASWGDIISKYLNELAGLDRGTFLLDDTQALITGDTTSVELRDRINAAASAASLGYSEAATITVPDQAAVNVGSVGSESVCQQLFDDLKGDAKINFASGSAEIKGRPSLALLGRLAAAINQCASFNVTIEGHTDSVGEEVFNRWLSEERAKAVVSNLVSQGVDDTRITAIGYGESAPKFSNDTDKGRSDNRRIEFKITTSE